MLHDTEIEIPEFIVRFNDNSSPCLTSPWSRSSSTVRSKQLEINSEGGICENVVEEVSPPHSQNTIPAQRQMIPEQSQRTVSNSNGEIIQ